MKLDPSLRWGLAATLTASVLLGALLWAPSTASYERIEPVATERDAPVPVVETEPPTPQPISEPAWKYPQLKRICSCESTGKPGKEPQHYAPNGEVLRGRVNSLDTGACQINRTYHEVAATKMGLDLFIESDNRAYAEYLYETQGTSPWVYSAHCWQ